jgi:hypothetical protein
MCFRLLSISLFLTLALSQCVQAQTLPNFDLLSKLELLQSESDAVVKILSKDTFTVLGENNRDVFVRSSENISVRYSTGTCSDVAVDESDWIDGFLGPDVWNVPAGKVIGIIFEPKTEVDIRNLGIDVTKLTKERLYRIYEDHFIYFNKTTGIAIKTWGTEVESIELFPGKQHHDKLCANPKVLKHFSRNKWRIIPEKNKNYCILFNEPSNVRDVSIIKGEVENKFEITVSADDDENDVMTFNYFVTEGKITSKGAKATWDLTGVKPGTYEIKVAADDGVGPRGLWASKSVTIN